MGRYKPKVKGLSDSRLAELRYFCAQYEVWKRRRPENAEMIEQAAVAADPDLYAFVLRHVADGVPYHGLRISFGMPAGAGRFYASRKRFFLILDRARK
jgi:hypothetical protein